MSRIKLAMISCGLGNVSRGFEISCAQWFDAVSERPELDVRLFSGGRYPRSTVVWNFQRDLLASWPLLIDTAAASRWWWELSYGMEQVSYACGLLPHLLWWRPHVVWTKEAPLVHILLAFRRALNLDYKIVFANGAPFAPDTYRNCDFIQQLQPAWLEEAEAAGIPAARMQVLPNCLTYTEPQVDRITLRQKYGFAAGDWIVLCVAAWNRYHKRIDYLIEEVAALGDPSVKLLLCGQPEPETPSLKHLAENVLEDRVRWLTLPQEQVSEALFISDVFVLASLNEGLGNALIEAVMAGLPVVAHRHAGGRFILEDESLLSDLSGAGALTARLRELRANPLPADRLQQMRQRAVVRFGQEALVTDFVAMVQRACRGSAPVPSPGGRSGEPAALAKERS